MESKQWNPTHWTDNHRKKTTRRMKKFCYDALKDFIGPYNAALAMAAIYRDFDEEKSVQMLKSMGVKTVGEYEALNLLNSK